MSWVTLAVAGGAALKGAADGYLQKDNARINNELRAEQIRYSPWSGLAVQGYADPGYGALSGGFDGAVKGALVANQLGAAPAAAAPAPAANPWALNSNTPQFQIDQGLATQPSLVPSTPGGEQKLYQAFA